MPWEHCGQNVADDVRCPSCGISKGAWTVKLDKTRMFKLSGEYEGDAAGQADTLKRAAASGTPFCEKCEKARQERERAAASGGSSSSPGGGGGGSSGSSSSSSPSGSPSAASAS